MIQWMHRLSKSFVATMLMGVLALSFVVWGIGDIFGGATASAVATVGGVNIESTVFQRNYRNFLRIEGQRMGIEITPEMARSMGMGQRALQEMVDRQALDNYAAKLGVAASDEQVTQTVHGIEGFRGPNGQFNYQNFLQAISQAQYTEADFLGEVRTDLARTQLTGTVEAFFGVPGEYSLAVFQYMHEKRAADYVVVPSSAAGTIATPDAKTLAAFIKENPARFSTPEYRDVQFAYATPADVAVEVTDKMVADEYTARKATYNVPERRELWQLEFKSEAEAKAARAKIDAGTTFEKLAEERGLKPADISLGVKSGEELGDPAAAKAAFAVGEGQVSQPVQGTFAWLLLKSGKVTPGNVRSLDMVKDELRETLKAQLAADKLVDVLNVYDEARKNGEPLAAAATKAKMKTGRIAAMDARGLTPDGSPAVGLPADPEFLATAFSADVGADNDPVSAKSGAYYVVRINGTTPPKLKPMAEIQADAEGQWIARKRAELLAVKAKTLNDQAVKEKSLAGIAAALGATVEKSPALQRDTNTPAMPAALITKLFEAKADGIVYAPQRDGYIIARLTGISHPKPQPGDKDFPAQAQQLSASVAGDIAIAMAASARAEQKATVNQKNLDAVIGVQQ